jgi:hypothetical protein
VSLIQLMHHGCVYLQMAEAWVTLANLTVDEAKREELLLYAQTEIRNKMDLDDGEGMDQSA